MPPFENAASFDDRNTIVFRRFLSAPVQRSWQALSSKSELDQWFMETEIDLRRGGRFSFRHGWDGWIGDLDPLHLIQFNTSDQSFTRFEVEGDGDFTRFTLTDRLRRDFRCPEDLSSSALGLDDLAIHQPGGPGTHWTGVAAGWHGFVDALERHLGGRPHEHPNLLRRYDELLSRHWAQPPAA